MDVLGRQRVEFVQYLVGRLRTYDVTVLVVLNVIEIVGFEQRLVVFEAQMPLLSVLEQWTIGLQAINMFPLYSRPVARRRPILLFLHSCVLQGVDEFLGQHLALR